LGDIGKLFPDTDPKWKDAVSIELLKYIVELARMNGYLIAWVDTTIITERPRLSPYIEEMKTALSRAGIPTGLINIKAKTNEAWASSGGARAWLPRPSAY